MIGFWAIPEMRRNSAEGLKKKKVIVKQSWNKKDDFSADSGYVSNLSQKKNHFCFYDTTSITRGNFAGAE